MPKGKKGRKKKGKKGRRKGKKGSKGQKPVKARLIQRPDEPTLLACISHPVLRAVTGKGQSGEKEDWVSKFGTYYCEEDCDECGKLPLDEPLGLTLSPYFNLNREYSESVFSMNAHLNCTMEKAVECRISHCGLKFTKSDLFIEHLRTRHSGEYEKLWLESNFPFKPNAIQQIFGAKSIVSEDPRTSTVNWACMYCLGTFNRAENWQNHRKFDPICQKQVVELLFNPNSETNVSLSEKMQTSFEDFVCDQEQCVQEAERDLLSLAETEQEQAAAAAAPSCGNIEQMVDHVSEIHTNRAFICLTCTKVVPTNDHQHQRECLKCSPEGISGPRTLPISDQINMWAEEVIRVLQESSNVRTAVNRIESSNLATNPVLNRRESQKFRGV